MPTTTLNTSAWILEELHRELNQVLLELDSDNKITFFLEDRGTLTPEVARGFFLVEGPEEVSIQAKCTIMQVEEAGYEMHLDLQNGPIHCFNFPPANYGGENSEPAALQLARAGTSLLLNELERRLRARSFDQNPSFEMPPHVPRLTLDRHGSIRGLNAAARRVLEYSSEPSLPESFFSRVHGRNLGFVMQDLAYMVSQGKQYARWLLRLRTETGRWCWFRAKAKNHLDCAEDCIQVLIRPL